MGARASHLRPTLSALALFHVTPCMMIFHLKSERERKGFASIVPSSNPVFLVLP